MTTRRGFFGWIIGALAATKVPLPAPIPLATVASQFEFDAIVRKAFVPRVRVQVYNSLPMMSLVMKGKRDGP